MSGLQWILLFGAIATLAIAWVAHAPPPHPPSSWAWALVWYRRRKARQAVEKQHLAFAQARARRRDMLEPHERLPYRRGWKRGGL
jgi:hypothetical protein